MIPTIAEAVTHYYNQINSYVGAARDVKKADKHMDGFTKIFKSAVFDAVVHEKHDAIVEGAFLRKRWDTAYGDSDKFTHAMELKSIVLSKMGKCFSNRVEEAIGVAVDLRHKNPDIKMNYFLVIEDDLLGFSPKRTERLERIHDFCRYIHKDLALYNNVGCVIIDSTGHYDFIYSNLTDYVDFWAN